MKNLIETYSLTEIVVFVILFALALKELLSTIDWFKARFKSVYDKDNKIREEHEKIEDEIEDLNKFYDEKKKVDDGFEAINKAIDLINDKIAMLIDSDKESIKAYITDRHHHFVYDQAWIDDYSMDCLEKRFAIYEKEHGNSFAADLMSELRGLPKRPYLVKEINEE
jgi:hypothetical protein